MAPERSISIRLRADAGQYVSELGRARQATTQLGESAHQTQGAAGGLSVLGKVGGVAAAGLALGVGAAVKAYADFDEAMSGVRANVDATPAQFKAMSDGIRSAGTQFGFSAVEAAHGAEELAKAGISAADITGGALTGAMTLAAAGGVSVADASETAATAMSMFNLKAGDVGHIADVLANGANQSTASVGSLSQALAQGGGVAASFGMSLDDTVATLAMFDQNGLKGSDAGTSLKTMLTALAKPSEQAAMAMDDLGISAFDATGKFVGMADLQSQLKEKTKSLSDEQRGQAFATIFGTDAMRAANALMKDDQGFSTWQKGVQKTGTAADNASTRLDNLNGDLGKLKAALMDTLIGGGESGNSFLRPLVQGATAAVKALSAIPGPVKSVIAAIGGLGLGGLAAAAGIMKLVSVFRNVRGEMGAARAALSSYNTAQSSIVRTSSGAAVQVGRFGSSIQALGTHVPVVARMQSAFVTAAASAERFPRAAGVAAGAMSGLRSAGAGLMGALGGPWGLALAGASVAVGLWAKHQQDAARKAAEHKAAVDQLTEALRADEGQLGKNVRAQVAKSLADQDAFITGRKYGLSVDQVTDAAMGNKTAIDQVTEATSKHASSTQTAGDTFSHFGKIVGSFVSGNTVGGVAEQMNDYNAEGGKFIETVIGQSSAIDDSKQQYKDMAQAVKSSGQGMTGASEGAKLYTAATEKAAGAQKKAKAAADALKQGISGVNNAFLQSEASSDSFQGAIDSATASLKENGRSLDANTEKGRANRSALRDIVSSGMAYADSLAKQGGSATEVAKQVYATRDAYVKAAVAAGMSVPEAKRLAEQYAAMPKEVTTKIKADVTLAKANLEAARLAVKSLGVDFDSLPADVQTKIIASGGADAKQQLDDMRESAVKAGQNVFVKSGTDAPLSMQKLSDLSVAAVNADGKVVSIPCSTPAQATALHAILALDGAAVNADGKSITIPASALTAGAIKDIRGLDGVAVSADGKSVTINTSAPGAVNAENQIAAALRAAQDKTVTITTIYSEKHISYMESRLGAAALSTGGAVFGPGTETSDSIPAWLSHNEHVLDAQDVRNLGGHPAVYTLRRMAAAGWRVPGYATGGAVTKGGVPAYATGGAAWSPDMSGIMSMMQALAQGMSVTDARKAVSDTTSALAKARRDLDAARAKYRDVAGGKHTAAQEIAAHNKVADAMDKERKATQALTGARSSLSAAQSRQGLSAGRAFSNAVGSRSFMTKGFLDDIDAISKVSKPLALSLLNQGDDDAVRVAHSYAAGPVAEIRRGAAALSFNDQLTTRKESLVAALSGSVDPSGKAAANAELLAIRGANNARYYATGVASSRPQPVTADPGMIQHIVDQVAKALPVRVVTNAQVVMPNGQVLAEATTAHQDTQSRYGTTMEGLRY